MVDPAAGSKGRTDEQLELAERTSPPGVAVASTPSPGVVWSVASPGFSPIQPSREVSSPGSLLGNRSQPECVAAVGECVSLGFGVVKLSFGGLDDGDVSGWFERCAGAVSGVPGFVVSDVASELMSEVIGELVGDVVVELLAVLEHPGVDVPLPLPHCLGGDEGGGAPPPADLTVVRRPRELVGLGPQLPLLLWKGLAVRRSQVSSQSVFLLPLI